jgi:hypothetical protein
VNSELLEWQHDSGNLATAVTNLQNSVSKALIAIETNVTNFAAFTKSGTFIQQLPNQNDLKNQILTVFNAFLISQAYQANGVFIARQTHISVRKLATNGTKLNFNTLCENDYDSNGVCDSFWYDSDDDTTYSLVSGDQHDQKNYNSDLQTWFANSNYTTPALLFKAADLCAHTSKSQQGAGPIIDFSSTAASPSCFSNMTVCTWNLDPQADTSENKANYPFPAWFSDCTNDSVFPGSASPMNCDSEPLDTFGGGAPLDYGGTNFFVPRTYLGWEILDNDVFGKAKGTYGDCAANVVAGR